MTTLHLPVILFLIISALGWIRGESLNITNFSSSPSSNRTGKDDFEESSDPRSLKSNNQSILNASSKENTFKEFYIKADNERNSKASNPSVDEIIGGIIQLLGGNNPPKAHRPPNKPPPPTVFEHDIFYPAGHTHNTRINNRGPAFSGPPPSNSLPHLFPPNILIGPGPPSGLPLPLSPYHKQTHQKPPPQAALPPKSNINLRLQEHNLTGLLGHSLVSHPKDPLRKSFPTPNTILPKPSIINPFREPLEPYSHQGSQQLPNFAAPQGNLRPPNAILPSRLDLESHNRHLYSPSPRPSLSSGEATPSLTLHQQQQPQQPVSTFSSTSSSYSLSPSLTTTDNGKNTQAIPKSTVTLVKVNPSAYPVLETNNEDDDSSDESEDDSEEGESSTTGKGTLVVNSAKEIPSLSHHHHIFPSSSPTTSVKLDSTRRDVTMKNVAATTSESSLSTPVSESTTTIIAGDSSDWFPVGELRPTKTWSEDPPMIITQEEPPSTFDITIRHKIGASLGSGSQSSGTVMTSTPLLSSVTPTMSEIPSSSTSIFLGNGESEVTTAINPSFSSPIPSPLDEKENFSVVATIISTITSTRVMSSTTVTSTPSHFSDTASDSTVTSTRVIPHHHPARPPSRTKAPVDEEDEEIVYGKPISSNRPIAPSTPEMTISGSGQVTGTHRPHIRPYEATRTASYHRTPIASISHYGHPVIVPVDMDEVRPKTGPSTPVQPSVVTDPGQGSVFIDGRPTHFKIRPTPTHVGSAVTISHKPGSVSPVDPPVRGSHRPPPSSPSSPSSPPSSASNPPAPSKSPAIRRPPFRPRPAVPIVRIDTCIVGDDSTCEVKNNERCKTEIGISSCQCRPGFGRSTPRGMCHPIITVAVSLRLDKMSDQKLTFGRNHMNPNSEEYQLLEYETIQGFNSMFALSRLSKVFMGVRVNKFYSASGRMLANVSIDLESNNMTRTTAAKRVVQQELSRVIALRNNNIGDSTLSVDSSTNSIPRVEDVNECQNPDLNDCSPHASCTNEFGSFRCTCKKGYDDKYSGDPKKSGRVCTSCSPSYCNNRGECHIGPDGERECKCRGNFIGAKCDIDVEVLGVAVGGSVAALVIIVITFLCLYMWNQKWKAEQQKIEAMSAASAQTFNFMSKQAAAAGYRYAIDDRYRWAAVPANEANFYATPEHVIASSQQHHVYATPSRVQTPDALMGTDEAIFESRQTHHPHHYSRPSRSKSRNSTLHGHSHYQSSIGPGSMFNETEFSTRETIYAPTHLVMTTTTTNPRTGSKYAVYS